MMLALAGLTSVTMAQTYTGYENASGDRYQVFTNRFWDNWFISIGGGGEMLLGNGDVALDIKDRISPTVNFSIGKWFTPGLGIRAQYSGFEARGATTDPNNRFITGGRQAEGYYKQKFKYFNVHGDILFNVSAMLGGYNQNRVYEFIPYLGFGFTGHYTGPNSNAIAVNGGLINRFRLSKAWDLNIELSIMGVENDFDGEMGGNFGLDGVVAASIGFTYRFPKNNFDKPMPARQIISEAELRNMRDRMNTLASENQNLRTELANRPTTTVVETPTVVRQVPDIAPRAAFFKIGSARVSEQELINLEFLADQMKEYPSLRFRVVGYADSATGSAERNKQLSIQRAQAVVDALVSNYGIDRSRMSTDGVGGVAKYPKPYLNRMVLIEVAQ